MWSRSLGSGSTWRTTGWCSLFGCQLCECRDLSHRANIVLSQCIVHERIWTPFCIQYPEDYRLTGHTAWLVRLTKDHPFKPKLPSSGFIIIILGHPASPGVLLPWLLRCSKSTRISPWPWCLLRMTSPVTFCPPRAVEKPCSGWMDSKLKPKLVLGVGPRFVRIDKVFPTGAKTQLFSLFWYRTIYDTVCIWCRTYTNTTNWGLRFFRKVRKWMNL